ncbi:RNA polymerase sigma factor SigF [Nocardia vaccinii]|uniref:RNA polymerase sigma factor SigF n=1 Tax=Nocardia vaccinii TaxID=1822 RepID=UPI000833FFAC|nr:RNA polymerase sigma factor SigF [Nocardia vaccinii]
MTNSSGPAKDTGEGYENLEPLFAEMAGLAEDDPRRRQLREQIISRCLPMAEHVARRFSGRGENFEDLLQIARVGLVAAVDRFDPDFGATFLGFAVPTVMGEVRRHFRDHAWTIRVPRRLKEIQLRLGPAIEKLSHELGRVPRAREIADELEVDLSEVTQALIARNAYQTASLDGADHDDSDSTPPLRDTLGAEEPRYEFVEDYLAVKPLLAALPDREREVLIMRFYGSMSQKQIADRLGCSQMQVSRLLAKTLKTLRQQALPD